MERAKGIQAMAQKVEKCFSVKDQDSRVMVVALIFEDTCALPFFHYIANHLFNETVVERRLHLNHVVYLRSIGSSLLA